MLMKTTTHVVVCKRTLLMYKSLLIIFPFLFFPFLFWFLMGDFDFFFFLFYFILEVGGGASLILPFCRIAFEIPASLIIPGRNLEAPNPLTGADFLPYFLSILGQQTSKFNSAL